jgi:hypothetical protein
LLDYWKNKNIQFGQFFLKVKKTNKKVQSLNYWKQKQSNSMNSKL